MYETLSEAILPLPNYYRGKVRDNYDLDDDRRIIITTDRLSAFDRPICEIPEKGRILTAISQFWFERTSDICPNHVLEYPDPNVLIAKRVEILPVEIVVRDYLAGTTATSILQMYKTGQRNLYGINFPEGLVDYAPLPWTMITPTTKSADHDQPITPKAIIADGLMTENQWGQIESWALELFARGRVAAHQAGLILADTKYEFGVDATGEIILADEIHTPDSSRYWFANTYPKSLATGEPPLSFDKDVIRRWISDQCNPYVDGIPKIPVDLIRKVMTAYMNAYCMITGQDFIPLQTDEPIIARIHRNLSVVANMQQPDQSIGK